MESHESTSQATTRRGGSNAAAASKASRQGRDSVPRSVYRCIRTKIFLPQKLINDHVQGVEYDFGEDLDGDKLMSNLSWLGMGGDIMDLVRQQEYNNEDEVVEDDDDESSYPSPQKKTRKIIGGAMPAGDEEFLSERSLRKALPEISQTLRNWTVHGQNLGHMVDEYKRKSRTMPVKSDYKLETFSIRRLTYWTR